MEKRTERMNLSLLPTEEALIKTRAEEAGQAPTAFARDLILKVIQDKDRYELIQKLIT